MKRSKSKQTKATSKDVAKMTRLGTQWLAQRGYCGKENIKTPRVRAIEPMYDSKAMLLVALDEKQQKIHTVYVEPRLHASKVSKQVGMMKQAISKAKQVADKDLGKQIANKCSITHIGTITISIPKLRKAKDTSDLVISHSCGETFVVKQKPKPSNKKPSDYKDSGHVLFGGDLQMFGLKNIDEYLDPKYDFSKNTCSKCHLLSSSGDHTDCSYDQEESNA